MTTIRVKKDARYFSASNEPFNDKRLSWETRGLMGYLLSKPNGWQVRMEGLEKAGPAGQHKLRRMLAEARLYGYMNRIRITLTGAGNKFDWVTEVYESPSLNPNPSGKILKASGRFSTSGSSTSGKLPDIVITEEVITESKDINDDAKIFNALSMLTGGGLNSNTPKFVDTWKEKHTTEWILRAIQETKERRIRSIKYVDEILVGWEAGGYPKSRDERVKERKHADNRKNSQNGAKSRGGEGESPPHSPSEADIQLAKQIKAERGKHVTV